MAFNFSILFLLNSKGKVGCLGHMDAVKKKYIVLISSGGSKQFFDFPVQIWRHQWQHNQNVLSCQHYCFFYL